MIAFSTEIHSFESIATINGRLSFLNLRYFGAHAVDFVNRGFESRIVYFRVVAQLLIQ